MSCLDNIVTYTNPCSAEINESSSGYRLEMAPEISPLNLADVANEKYVTGANMIQQVLENSILDIKNDFLGYLNGNNIITNLNNQIHTTSEFDPNKSFPATNKERGITLFRNSSIRGSIRKLKIKTIDIYPKVDVALAQILIYDSGYVYTYETQLTANLVNTIEVNYTVKGAFARILVDNTNIPMGSANLICFTGCGGKTPNDCGYVKGYDGTADISAKEGYGISVNFFCECDHEQLLCDFAKSYTGKLIYLKTRIKLLEERIYSNRANPLVIYGDEEATTLYNQLNGEYTESWNTFINSIPKTLQGYKDDCLSCKGVRWRTNI